MHFLSKQCFVYWAVLAVLSLRCHKTQGGAGVGHRGQRVPAEGADPRGGSPEWIQAWHRGLQCWHWHSGWGPPGRPGHFPPGVWACSSTALSDTHPPCPSPFSSFFPLLTLNISVLLVPVPVPFIFSLKYTDCQHPNSNQRDTYIFTLHLTSIFPAWFVLSLVLFSPYMTHFAMYFFCHLPPVCILHLISFVALPAVLNYPHGYSNFVQPGCVFSANEQLLSFSWSFSSDTIFLFRYHLLSPVCYQTQILVYSVKFHRRLHLSAFFKFRKNLESSYFLHGFLWFLLLTVPLCYLSPVSHLGLFNDHEINTEKCLFDLWALRFPSLSHHLVCSVLILFCSLARRKSWGAWTWLGPWRGDGLRCEVGFGEAEPSGEQWQPREVTAWS